MQNEGYDEINVKLGHVIIKYHNLSFKNLRMAKFPCFITMGTIHSFDWFASFCSEISAIKYGLRDLSKCPKPQPIDRVLERSKIGTVVFRASDHRTNPGSEF